MYFYDTELAYYKDFYATKLKTHVLSVGKDGNKLSIILESTIFYPFGGGQPADQGTIITDTGKANVRNVQMKDQIVIHDCVLEEGNIEEEQDAYLEIDWDRRYKNMRVHTAGHIIHDVLMEKKSDLIPVRGDHGSKPYLEYTSSNDNDLPSQEELEKDVNKVIGIGRSVVTRETTFDELEQIARFIPPNLPKNKPLRIIQIEGFPAMPDGGTQLNNINEIGKIEITSLNPSKGKLVVKYRVHDS